MNPRNRWKLAVGILCMFGVCKSFRPTGRSIISYAVRHRNFTMHEMVHLVVPAAAPATMIYLTILLMVTDAVGYKRVLIAGAIGSVITWTMTIWFFTSVMLARIRGHFYGFAVVATELAYFSYMYANIEKSEFKRATSFTEGAILTGKFLSATTNQICVSFKLMDLEQMNYLSLGGAFGCLLMACILPRTLKTFVQEEHISAGLVGGKGIFIVVKANMEKFPMSNQIPETFVPKKKSFLQKIKAAPRLAKENFLHAYRNPVVLKWSAWQMVAFGTAIQVNVNVESLWLEIIKKSGQPGYGGAVHASHSIVSVFLGLWVGNLKLSWALWGNGVFAIVTFVQGTALLLMSYTYDLYQNYGCLIIFNTGYQVLTIISKALVAEHVRESSEAFIFGINALVAFVFHFILTLVLSSRVGLVLPMRKQIVVFASITYTTALGLLLLACRQLRGRQNKQKTKEEEVEVWKKAIVG